MAVEPTGPQATIYSVGQSAAQSGLDQFLQEQNINVGLYNKYLDQNVTGANQVVTGVDPKTGSVTLGSVSNIRPMFPALNKNLQAGILSAMKATGRSISASTIQTFMGDVLEFSAAKYAAGGQAVPWWQDLDPFVNAYSQARAAGGGGRGGGGPTKAVNLTDPGTAKQLINQSLQQYLGRNATPRELKKFVDSLNRAEMRNPQERAVVGSTAVSMGGFNPSTFAEDYAAGMEGAGEFQAVTAGLDNFINALANPVEVL